jgi:predicted transcriptional regulator
MQVVWDGGRLSAREVHEAVSRQEVWEYSTTRTLLGRLVKKGAVSKRSFHGLQLYEAKISRAEGLAQRVRDFAERVVQVNPALVVPLFAESGTLSPAEIEEITRLLAGEEEAS